MRILGILLILQLAWCCFGRDAAALFYAPPGNIWLEDPVAAGRLETLFAERGVKVEYARDVPAYLALEKKLRPTWIVYAPAEVIPSALVDTLKRQLREGARVITGAGMPFWYEIGDNGETISADGRIGEKVAGIRGSFVNADSAWTELGGEVLGKSGSFPGISRGIGTAVGNAVLLPLACSGDVMSIGAVACPEGGKLFFAGTGSLSNGELNILAPEGEKCWNRILEWLARSSPSLKFQSSGPREIILGTSGTPKTIDLRVVVSNPADTNIEGRLRLKVRRSEGFGKPEMTEPGNWQNFKLRPDEKRTLKFTFRLPDAADWSVWLAACESEDGMTTEIPLHLLPPAAVDYLDVDPLLAPPGSERSFTAGIYGFVAGIPLRLLFERRLDNGEWKTLADRTITSVRGILPVALPAERPETDALYRVRLLSASGRDLHETLLRVTAGEENPAFRRGTAMFRALDGLQFTWEKDFLFDDLKRMQQQWPLFHGLQPARLAEGVHDWMRANGFLLNYGAMLNDINKIERWGLNDANWAGVSASRLMPGHCEDPALWLVRQNSRSRFADIVREEPDIANLVEAVPGYETPGLFSAAERGGSEVSHFLGYAPLGVSRHWEAPAGIDGGVRQLEPGGKRFRRITFPELYEQIYNEKLPRPAEFGWSDWKEYRPLHLNQAQQHGALTAKEVKLFRLHYLIRTYYHLKRLDDLSAWLHQSAGEVHNVAHEGPLIAQISALTYRLPYVDTNTMWMFRSAWAHGWGVSNGTAEFLREYSGLFQHRFGLHEEIGGGQWASYRTAETSFVSVFVKRATVPFADLQVDFYLGADRAYRVKEELAMFRGFQLAVDTKARPAAEPHIALAGSSASYFPELKKGVIRDEVFGVEMVNFANLLRGDGIPFRTVSSPLVSPELLKSDRLLFWSSEHPMAGDLEVLRKWLAAEPGRVLVLNHVGSWNCDYTDGCRADELKFDRTRRPLEVFGLSGRPAPEPVRFSALNGVPLQASVTGFYLPPPVGAEPLMKDDSGRALVWKIPVEHGTLIYSGLPFGNVKRSDDPAGTMVQAWRKLLAADGWRGNLTVAPENWFVGTYRLADGRLAVAAIHPGEAKIANRDYGATGDGVEKAAAQLGVTEVSIRWNGAAEAGSRWRAVDAWSGTPLEGEFRAGEDGSLELKIPVPVAKLYFLERIQ